MGEGSRKESEIRGGGDTSRSGKEGAMMVEVRWSIWDSEGICRSTRTTMLAEELDGKLAGDS
jgi:hypothetical protein